MAATSLQSLHHRLLHKHHHRHHPSSSSSSFPFPFSDSSFFVKLNATRTQLKLFSNLSSSPSSSSFLTTPSPVNTSTSSAASLELLAEHLTSGDFRRADEVTRRLLIALAGEAAQKRGYVFFSEVQFIPADDLAAVDRLWVEHSRGRFGYSVQRRVWEKARRDFTGFFIKVGWMKKLDSEVEQYNYRAFPEEFMWELGEGTPEGHLPLTNALRGTQLLGSILTHPAFDGAVNEEPAGGSAGESQEVADEKGSREVLKPMSTRRLAKPDYSF